MSSRPRRRSAAAPPAAFRIWRAWRGSTRICGRELFLDDADYLTDELDILIGHLQEYADALKSKDAEHLRALLRDGREKKATAGGN